MLFHTFTTPLPSRLILLLLLCHIIADGKRRNSAEPPDDPDIDLLYSEAKDYTRYAQVCRQVISQLASRFQVLTRLTF